MLQFFLFLGTFKRHPQLLGSLPPAGKSGVPIFDTLGNDMTKEENNQYFKVARRRRINNWNKRERAYPWFLSIAFCRSILQNFQQDIQNTSHRGRCDATDNSSYPMTARTLHVKPGVPSLEAMEYLPCTTWEVMNNPVTVRAWHSNFIGEFQLAAGSPVL